ncbi:hypothetical protein PLESTB_001267600 [Pleodorina starrii]|uniref:U-box domain-containing protein n=1 Tax=Pleodorina starrii TaxID=330485 RepID=A0A9W6F674_9CHLO|nr:hypothetical protein PLESTB_001267600 [Pleodorina starrii]
MIVYPSITGMYLDEFKDIANGLALSLRSLQWELGLLQLPQQEQERQDVAAANGLSAAYNDVTKRLEELEFNALYFMAEMVKGLKTKLITITYSVNRSSSSGTASGSGDGGGDVAESTITGMQRRAILKALEEAGVVGPQEVLGAGSRSFVEELGASVSAAIRTELEGMTEEQMLEAIGFLVTVAHALTSLPPSSPPVQARDGDDEDSAMGAPPAAAAVQRQPAAAGASAAVAEAAADRPTTPPQPGGAATAASVAASAAPAAALSVLLSFVCPISMTIMRDPVILVESGHTFERETIEAHFRNSDKNPLTNLRLSSKTLVPNLGLRGAIEEWLSKHGLTADQADELPSGGGPSTQAPEAAPAAAPAAAAAAAAAPATPDQVVPDRGARRDVAKRLATARNEASASCLRM